MRIFPSDCQHWLNIRITQSGLENYPLLKDPSLFGLRWEPRVRTMDPYHQGEEEDMQDLIGDI